MSRASLVLRRWTAPSSTGIEISGLFGYLITRDDVAVERNPVPTGLANRRRGSTRGAPLLRTPRTLPRVLDAGEVEAVLGALNTARDRAMVLAMLLGGLRRCEVLGLRLGDLSPGERRIFVVEGKGGLQRLIPISSIKRGMPRGTRPGLAQRPPVRWPVISANGQ